MKKIFAVTALYSLIDDKYKDNYYSNSAVQNRWNENCARRTGVVVIDDEIMDFIDAHDIISIRIRFYRRDSFHGINAEVRPDLKNYNLPVQAQRGEWTDFAEVDIATFLDNKVLYLGTGQTGELYAIWEQAEIEICYS